MKSIRALSVLAVALVALYFAAWLPIAPAPAKAAMVAVRQVSLEKFLAYFRLQKNDPDSASQTVLAETARDALQITEVSLPFEESEAHSLLKADMGTVVRAMADRIRALADWDEPVSAAAKAKLHRNKDLLEKAFKGQEDIWLWFRAQIGEKAEAKKRLLELFDENLSRVMALKEARYGLGQTPMGEAEYLQRALKTLANPDELKSVEEKMGKMRVHVSNLPQMMIMT